MRSFSKLDTLLHGDRENKERRRERDREREREREGGGISREK
jgi:hypothetical protein